MKAAYVKAPGQVEFREVPIPELGPKDVLVKIAACGVCGTDVHFGFHQVTDWQPMGHELAGVVARVGAGVTRVRPGDRVTVECDAPCGQCADCGFCEGSGEVAEDEAVWYEQCAAETFGEEEDCDSEAAPSQ